MEIVYKKLDELRSYEGNPRKNESAVQPVANSIEEFGFKVPMVIEPDGTIVAGHTRLKAAEMLGMEEVPCIVADDLTPEQLKAFRLADNKVAEFASWDWDKLDAELASLSEIDMGAFGFDDGFNIDIDDLFEDAHDNGKEKEPKTVICPNCGEEIEL